MTQAAVTDSKVIATVEPIPTVVIQMAAALTREAPSRT